MSRGEVSHAGDVTAPAIVEQLMTIGIDRPSNRETFFERKSTGCLLLAAEFRNIDSRGTARREHAKRITPPMRRPVAVSLDSPIDSLRVNGLRVKCQYPRLKTAQRDSELLR